MKKKSKAQSVQPVRDSRIRRESDSWGDRISIQPLPNKPMEIAIEVYRTAKPKIRVAFHGASRLEPLTILNAEAWHTAFGVMLAEARKIAEEQKNG